MVRVLIQVKGKAGLGDQGESGASRPTAFPGRLAWHYTPWVRRGSRMQLRAHPPMPAGGQEAGGETAPADIREPRLRELWQYWARKRDGTLLPGRAAISPHEMRPWLGYLLLMDVVEGGRDFRYRLHGTQLVQLFGVDLTGQLVGALRVRDVDRLLAEGRLVVASHNAL